MGFLKDLKFHGMTCVTVHIALYERPSVFPGSPRIHPSTQINGSYHTLLHPCICPDRDGIDKR